VLAIVGELVAEDNLYVAHTLRPSKRVPDTPANPA
jgi:hypothetical protein